MAGSNEIELIFWLGTLAMLVFAMGIILLSLFYQNRLQQMKKREAKLLLNASLEMEKKERTRIASDLHDGICGDLNAARNFVELLDCQIQDESHKSILSDIKEGITTALSDTRNISHNLMPPLLETSGLIGVLESYLGRLNHLPHLKTQLILSQHKVCINPSISYELYRIIQELVSNMLNHNDINQLVLSFEILSPNIRIHIKDDGHKFDIWKQYRISKGSGIKNVMSRIQHIEAVLQQHSSPIGNHISITIQDNKC